MVELSENKLTNPDITQELELPEKSSGDNEKLKEQQEIWRQADALMTRINDERFMFVDPESGILVQNGEVIDLMKEGNDWVATVNDEENKRHVRIRLSLLTNIELFSKE